MLEAMRKGAQNIVVKIFLILLAVTFVAWGVGDIIRGRSSDEIASVGELSITKTEFEEAKRRQILSIQSMVGRTLTEEQIESLQVSALALNQLIDKKLMAMETFNLGLMVGDKVVSEKILSFPVFRDSQGRFSKAIFEQMLRSNGYTETTFIQSIKHDVAATFLTNSLTEASFVYPPVVEALYKVRNEKRVVDLITVTKDAVTFDQEPTNEELMQYHETHQQRFEEPEYRSISYITLDPRELGQEIDITEEELQQVYEERLSEYISEEERDVEQMFFTEEAKAQKAYERLEAKEDFYVVAKEEANTEKASMSLGYITRGDLLPQVNENVFDLEKGAYSSLLRSGLGWHIFRVKDIKPASQKPFKEVRDDLEKWIKVTKAGDILYALSTQIEDLVASGMTLQEVAKEVNLEVARVDGVSFEGKSDNHRLVEDLPRDRIFFETAFNTPEGEVSPMVIPENSMFSYFVQVDGITPSRIQSLDEVRGAAITAWKEQRHLQEVRKLAEDIKAKIESGIAVSSITKHIKVAMDKDKILSRKVGDEGLPEPLLQELFTLKIGGLTRPQRNSKGEFILAQVKEIQKANFDSEGVKALQIKNELKHSYSGDIIAQYMKYLRKKYPVLIQNLNAIPTT